MFVSLFSILFYLAYLFNRVNGLPIISNNLHTWWHNNIEYNDNSPVRDSSVRASNIYSVQVATTDLHQNNLYDSFTYMSIPRGGRQKWEYDSSDGAEFAEKTKLTMSWSTFQYLTDVWVIVKLNNSMSTIDSIDHVTIRPITLNFKKELVDSRTIRISVPYRAAGYRFSVEFKKQLFTTYHTNYGPSENTGGQAIHTEPRQALLIFAESIVTGDQIDEYIPNPDIHYNNIYYVPQGEVKNLNIIKETVAYFEPGIYYMPWNYHAIFPTNVHWIYLAPGAYVKGAFQFQSTDNIKVTGFGVLSGEKYVYEADVANNYHHSIHNQCWATCVKMLRFTSDYGKEQYLQLHGITISEPPYHSFVVYGDDQTFHMSVSSYHQVGSWYWQTDGLEIYRGSSLANTFFHSNDDVLKIYHSDVIVRNIVVWKNENGPVIQWGWSPRTINNVTVDQIDIIHNRIWWSDIKHNTCIINSATHYDDTESTNTADPNQLIEDLIISNIRSEGMNSCAMRIYALSSIQSITIKNLWIEQWNQLDKSSQISIFKAYEDKNGNQVTIGNQSNDKKGLALINYTVGTTKITKVANNWQDTSVGRLYFDANLWDSWDAY
ncbi:unnamed protein product [Rotaria socialis]|uniref:Dextranase n=1 Tax=Rotaria socialis TaxID=392032 RepID=A0A820VG94_9BILA|nr:unnamed protein product [Rotaria socialis]CAF4499640.1 unnamed protein product [Rotaria socialis]